MVAVPAPTPVTTPVAAFTVAMEASEVDQLPPLTVEEKVVVPATQIAWVPDSVPAEGAAVTVMVPVALTEPQPPLNGIE